MPPNILLVILDSLRAKNTSIHGYERDTTPFLSDWTNETVVFEEARAPSVASLPSHVSIFTGYHTIEHRFNNDEHSKYRLRPGTTIWEELSNNYGYTTGIFSDNPYLTDLPIGIQSAFDTVVDGTKPPFPSGINPHEYHDGYNAEYLDWLKACLRSNTPVRSLLNGLSMKMTNSKDIYLPGFLQPTDLIHSFFNWINDDSISRPWAACINLMDTHKPYKPKQKYDEWSDGPERAIQKSIDHSRWEFISKKRSLNELQIIKQND
jgi:arylsulfatase A-like enzyme